MLLFPPLSPSPPHSCPAEVFHTLHPYGRLVQPCPAWSTTHSLQKEQELKPEINVNRRIINQGYVSRANTRANTRALQHREGILPSLLFSPAWGSLSVLPLHSSLFLNFIMWSSQECFPLSLQSLPRLLALSLYEKQGSLLLTAVLVWGSVCVYMCLSMSTIVLCHAHLSSLCTETEILTVCFTCQRTTPKAHMWTQNRTNKDTKSFIL